MSGTEALAPAIGYDADTQTLAIQFTGRGVTCHYAGVPPATYAGLQKAESKGRYFGSAIKDQYEFKTLPLPDPDKG